MDGKPFPKLLQTEGSIDNYEQGAVRNYAECMDGIIKSLADQVDDLRTILARTRRFIYSGPPRNGDWDSEAVLSSDIRRALHNPACKHEWSAARRGTHECLKGCGAAMHSDGSTPSGEVKS